MADAQVKTQSIVCTAKILPIASRIEEQLRAATDASEAASRSKSEFLAT